MKKMLGLGLLLSLTTVSAANFKMSSRTYEENKNGEIIQVDGKTVDASGTEVMSSAIMRARINNENRTFTNTQHILIPATSDVRARLLNSSGTIEVEGTLLNTNIVKQDIATFKHLKILVREVK